MEPYTHVVQYYETDKMGITHHSNYVRWMEESRIDFLKKIGWDYAKLEEVGVISPVVDISVKYKRPTTFSDEVKISVQVVSLSLVTVKFHYEMRLPDDTLAVEAESTHCFVNGEGRPVRLSKQVPEFYEKMQSLCSEKTN